MSDKSDKALTPAELEVTQKIQTHFPRGLPPEILGRANSCPVATLADAVKKMLEGLAVMVFRIRRGGKRTTEEVVGATTHTYINPHITSADFPLTETAEEERELVAFQVPEYDHDPSSAEILKELEKRGLERPTYEDALKFDEAHPDAKGFFVFLHEPWLDPDRDPVVVVVNRDEAHRVLTLYWFVSRWGRFFWFVGVRPRK